MTEARDDHGSRLQKREGQNEGGVCRPYTGWALRPPRSI